MPVSMQFLYDFAMPCWYADHFAGHFWCSLHLFILCLPRSHMRSRKTRRAPVRFPVPVSQHLAFDFVTLVKQMPLCPLLLLLLLLPLHQSFHFSVPALAGDFTVLLPLPVLLEAPSGRRSHCHFVPLSVLLVALSGRRSHRCLLVPLSVLLGTIPTVHDWHQKIHEDKVMYSLL